METEQGQRGAKVGSEWGQGEREGSGWRQQGQRGARVGSGLGGAESGLGHWHL